jgi:hypothetical protein
MKMTSRMGLVAGTIAALGAAVAIGQQGQQGQQPAGRQPPGQVRTPPGQDRTPPGQMDRQPGQTDRNTGGQTGGNVDTIIARWPESSQKAAREMIQKYGPPNTVNEDVVCWKNNGPWKETKVFGQTTPHEFPMHHDDCLVQVISFKAPPDKADELAQFDGSIWVHRTEGELAAKCDKEENNFLALNLANEIITGKRTVDDARAFLAQTAMEAKQGKQSSYTQGLMFDPQSPQQARDPDQAFQDGGSSGMGGNTGGTPGIRPSGDRDRPSR